MLPEGLYRGGGRGGHEPDVGGDVDEVEAFIDGARGVLGGSGKDAGAEAPLAGGADDAVHGLDQLGLLAVHAGTEAEGLSQVGGADEDGIQAGDGEDVV